MTTRMDANSMRVRNIRAHIRQGFQQYRDGGLDWPLLSRFLTTEQQALWTDASARAERVRQQQQDARYLSQEADQWEAANLVEDGWKLKQRRDSIMRERLKFRTYTSTNESRKRVMRRKLRRHYREYVADAYMLYGNYLELPDEAWDFVKPASNKFKWLIEYKSDVEIAPIPHEILYAEQYALFEAWIGECTDLIDNYESKLAGSSIR